MAKKPQDWKDRLNVVYSTNPNFQYQKDSDEDTDTPAPTKQDLKVWLEKNNRGGKTASVIKGFVGKEDDLKELGKLIKTKCGVGGSVKDGEIIIQGDLREKIIQILAKEGYRAKKAGG